MNWLAILAAVVQDAPSVIKLVTELTGSLKQTTAASTTGTASSAAAASGQQSAAVARAPSDTVKAIQKLLNEFVKPQPPLVVDGWLGAKTEKAINDALEMAKPYIAMFGR